MDGVLRLFGLKTNRRSTSVLVGKKVEHSQHELRNGYKRMMITVRFELTPCYGPAPEAGALDHSARLPRCCYVFWLVYIKHNYGKLWILLKESSCLLL
jgi:hypothetical protein